MASPRTNTLPSPPLSPIMTSPEAAPADVVLAQVLQFGRLRDQFVDLSNHVQLFARLEVESRKLLRDAIENLAGAGNLHLDRTRHAVAVDDAAGGRNRSISTRASARASRPAAQHGRIALRGQDLRGRHVGIENRGATCAPSAGLTPSNGQFSLGLMEVGTRRGLDVG